MKKVLVVAVVIGLAALWACSSDNGTVRIILTDAPIDGVESLKVTISKVEIHLVPGDLTDGGWNSGQNEQGDTTAKDDDNAWRVVSDKVQTFDLLTLRNGVTALLGEGDFPEGMVTQVRLTLDKAEAVVKGKTVPVDCPASCAKTGIKIVTNGALKVSAGLASEITLDFVAAASLQDNGKDGYRMEHVIKVVREEQR